MDVDFIGAGWSYPLGVDPTGRVALVTGANNAEGIGAAIAATLAREGVQVCLAYLPLNASDWGVADPDPTAEAGEARYHGLRATDAKSVLDRIQAEGHAAHALEIDLADPGASVTLFDWAESTAGPVSILVHCAAHFEAQDTVDDLSAESIDRT